MAQEFPALYTRPSSAILLNILHDLQQTPSTFESASQQYAISRFDAREISTFLTGLISSPLSWLADEEREPIWDLASRRLSERAGRSGMNHLLPVCVSILFFPFLLFLDTTL